MNRRKFVTSAMGAGAALSLPRRARAQSITARQIHSQPETSHLHIYLSKIWDKVREETNGRLDVTVFHQNSGLAVGPTNILDTLRSGELDTALVGAVDLCDEAVHRAFGWDALDVLIEMDATGTRMRVAASLPHWISGFQTAYSDHRPAPPLTAQERAAGLLDLEAYADVFAEARRDIARRFGRRGIHFS